MAPSSRIRALAIASALLGVGLVAVAPAPASAASAVKLMVLGETHGTRSVTQDLVGIADAKGATGCVCPGDFIYGHWDASPSDWREMMAPFMDGMLPAQGNHDTPWSDWKGLFPDERPYYSEDVNGVLFVSVNSEHSLARGSAQREWLERTLESRPDSALKVLFLHRPWWLPEGATHPSSEFESRTGASASSMDSLVRATGVDLVVSAHEKNYQHSFRDGVHYLVAGGGGHEFVGMGYSLPGAVKRLAKNVVTTMEVTPDSLLLKSYDRSWARVETFTIAAGDGGAGDGGADDGGDFSARFDPHDGNEWWVQTRVDASESVARVDARVEGGSWKALSKRSWGSWAASFHVPDGSRVEFRATSSGGAVATSPAFEWPEGTLATEAFDATFEPHDGNEWWVQTRVRTDEPLAKVEARVDGGAWRALTLRSWGSWAASFHVPDGSRVEFRATSTDGSSLTSAAYVWPVR